MSKHIAGPKHVPGPWIAIEGAIYQDHSAERFINKIHLYLGKMDSRIDATRIVACVNAMEGIEDPAAARALLDDPRTAAATDMLEVLRALLGIGEYGEEGRCKLSTQDVVLMARKAMKDHNL